MHTFTTFTYIHFVHVCSLRSCVSMLSFFQAPCIQPPPLTPPLNASFVLTNEYKNKSISLLSNAIQIPTISYDDLCLDPLKDERLFVFKTMHSFLNKSFPLLTQHVEYVNTYGLLYTVNGKNKKLKPNVFMAHQDVVPVEEGLWEYPPFSGHFDGTRVWGRGAVDTKNSLVAILEAAEQLLENNFSFERTMLISLGFDEEVDGMRGAHELAKVIRQRYSSVNMILDEGSSVSFNGSVKGFVGVSEKGYMDLNFEVHAPGGHSSFPPDHTAIGILSDLLVSLEEDHLQNVYTLKSTDVVAEMYKCFAQFDDLTNNERQTYLNVNKLKNFLINDNDLRPLISTSQSIDIIQGGLKVNQLPELALAGVNYRIDGHESVDLVIKKVSNIVKAVASKYNAEFVVNNKTVLFNPNSKVKIVLTNGQSIEPSPVSPFGMQSAHWRIIAGTSMHVLNEYFNANYTATVPMAMMGNTDTYHYLDLTENVYRYTLTLPDSGANEHTVNEWILADSHLATVAWYYEMMQATNE